MSLWGAWAVTVPNPDAALYLRAAELILDGRWSDALQVYGWPTYSALIALVMKLTGERALACAMAVNAVFAVVTTLAFIGLARRLAQLGGFDAAGTGWVAAGAAIVILTQPQLTQLRSTIVRDNGYEAFFVLALYWVATDQVAPAWRAKLACALSILLAGLFRIEGFFLAAWVPAYAITRQPGGWKRPPVIAAAALAVLLAVPGVVLWSGGALGQWLAGQGVLGGPAHQSQALLTSIEWRVLKLRNEVLYPYGGGNAWSAYVGMTIGIVAINVARAMSVPLALLAALSLRRAWRMPRPAAGFVGWFAVGQVLVLAVFTFVNMLLDKRYAVGLALLLDLALVFLLVRLKRPAAIGVAVVLLAVWAVALPRPSKLDYLKTAGLWIGSDVAPADKVLTNDARIAYFSGRPYGATMRTWVYGFHVAPSAAELDAIDLFVLEARDPSELAPALQALPDKELVRTFEGRDGGRVFVYRRHR